MQINKLIGILLSCPDAEYGCSQCEHNSLDCREGLLKQAAEMLLNLRDAIPHKCACCVGCELEEAGGGCDEGFLLSTDRAREYISSLVAFRERMDHIKAIQYVAQFGNVSEDMVAYFDDRKISEKEVLEYITTSSPVCYNSKIVCINRDYAENVFGYKWEDSNG